ncbi:MAG: recombinase family protein, partial [Clostridia bacterium]|nr:recombinase family protein [Clostridia bacterium]
VINEEKANIVRKIFNEYVNENIGTQVISNRLNDLGIPSPRGKNWTPDAIRTILENIHYIGKVHYYQRKTVFIVDNGEFRKTRPKSSPEEEIIEEGKHEAIISEELFYMAQEKRGKCHRTCNNKDLRNPLASLLFCECGKAMVYRHSTRGNLKYRREPRLVCNGQKYCGNGSCSVTEMVDYVAEVLRQRIADFEAMVKNHGDESNDFHEKHLRSLEKKLTDLNAKEVALWEAQLDVENRMPPNVFQTITDKLVKERKEIESAIEKTKATISIPVKYETHLVNLKKALSALLDPNISVDEKNHFLKTCIDRIEYKREQPQRIIGKGTGRQWTTPPIEVDVRLKV